MPQTAWTPHKMATAIPSGTPRPAPDAPTRVRCIGDDWTLIVVDTRVLPGGKGYMAHLRAVCQATGTEVILTHAVSASPGSAAAMAKDWIRERGQKALRAARAKLEAAIRDAAPAEVAS